MMRRYSTSPPWKLAALATLIVVGTATCQVTSYPFVEDFEPIPGGWAEGQTLSNGWTQATAPADQFNWDVEAGTTTSTATGPTVDHTTGLATGLYVYIETSGPAVGAEAHLLSPMLDAGSLVGGTSLTVDFWYHMYGADMGSLHLDYWDGVAFVNVFSLVGQQQTATGDPWLNSGPIVLPLPLPPLTQLRFRGIRGTSFNSDACVDDVTVSGVLCAGGCTTAAIPMLTLMGVPPLRTAAGMTLVDTTVCGQDNVTPTCQAGGDDSIVQFVSPFDGSATVSTCNAGTTYNTVLQIIEGDCLGTPIACNDDGASCVMNQSEVTFPVTFGQTYTIGVDGFGGATGTADLTIDLTEASCPGSCADPILIAPTVMGPVGAEYSNDTFNVDTTRCGYDNLVPSCEPGGDDVVIQFVAPYDGIAQVDTCGAGTTFDTAIAVLDGGCMAMELDCNDDTCGTSSAVTFNMVTGSTYTLLVDGFAGATGIAEVTLSTVAFGCGNCSDGSGGNLTLMAGAHTIDTDTGEIDMVLSPAWDGRAFHFVSVDIQAGATVSVTGSQGLVLLATMDLTVNGDIDASGGNGGPGLCSAGPDSAPGSAGPGGFPGGAGATFFAGVYSGEDGFGPGGAQGGTAGASGGGGGGHSVPGASAPGGAMGGAAYGSGPPLLGGSGGGGGGGQDDGSVPADDGGGGGGGGGGFVFFGASGTVTVNGNVDCSGGDGGNSGCVNYSAGGGGGSGGRIVIESGMAPITGGLLDVSGGVAPGPAPTGGVGAAGYVVTGPQACPVASAPIVTVTTPTSPASGDIDIDIDVMATSMTVDLTFDFSIDMGTTWFPCVATVTSPLPNPALGAPTGMSTFTWDSTASGVGTIDPQVGVLVRVTTRDSASCDLGLDPTMPFDVDNEGGLCPNPAVMLTDLTLTMNHTIDTDTGEIDGMPHAGWDGLAFNFANFDLQTGATLAASGSQPLLILVQANATIAGTLDASGADGADVPACPPLAVGTPAPAGGAGGPGGGDGGAGAGIPAGGGPLDGLAGSGLGAGGGGRTTATGCDSGGGGGAGHVAPGSAGLADAGGATGGAQGAAYVSDGLLLGGSGGGGASNDGGLAAGAAGGGGGGYVRIDAGVLMVVASGLIDASGGNGGGDTMCTCSGTGGGGSGGTVELLSASMPVIAGTIVTTGGLGGNATGGTLAVGGDGAAGRMLVSVSECALCPGLCGDCDRSGGVPNIVDALVAAQIAAGLIVPTMAQEGCCDVDSSGLPISVIDSLLIAQAAAGLPAMLVCP